MGRPVWETQEEWRAAAPFAVHYKLTSVHGAVANRKIKQSLSDWGFADAVIALGPIHALMVDGIRQMIRKSLAAPGSGRRMAAGESVRMPAPDEEFVIVTHSLGSYLLFSALNVDPAEARTPLVTKSVGAYAQVPRQTSLVYFFANQVPLLELANLDQSPEDQFVSHLKLWGKVHCEYQQQEYPGTPCRLLKLLALNDPSDLLT